MAPVTAMFGPLGFPEMIFILVLALLIFGPKRLPEVGKTLGKGMAQFRKATSDLRRTIETEISLESDTPRPPARATPPTRPAAQAKLPPGSAAASLAAPAAAEAATEAGPVEATVTAATSDVPAPATAGPAAAAGDLPAAVERVDTANEAPPVVEGDPAKSPSS